MNILTQLYNLIRGVINTTATSIKVEEQSAKVISDGSAGTSISRKISAASNNATVAKNAAGNLYSVIAINTNAAVRYLKFYNKATAPDPANDTPVLTIPIPGNTAGAGVAHTFNGLNFSTGISYAIVVNVGDTDNTSVAANEIVVNIEYK